MNKQVFNFHFKTGFLWVNPDFGNWRKTATDFLWWLPGAFLLGIDGKKLLEASLQDIPTILGWWLSIGFLVQFVAPALVGLIYGLVQLVRFHDYECIERSPGYRAFLILKEHREFKRHCAEHIPKEKERIIASANLTNDGTVWAVLRPGRHHHCIWYMAQYGRNHEPMQQGFLTNKFRFLGRQDARKLAMENGQCLEPDHNRDLFSEDLWATPAHLRQQG